MGLNFIYKHGLSLFIAMVLLFIGIFITNFSSNKFETSLFALLPQESTLKLNESLSKEVFERIDSQVIVLIESPSFSNSQQDLAKISIAKSIYHKIKSSNFVESIIGFIDEEEQKYWAQDAFKYRFSLFDLSTRKIISSIEAHKDFILSQIYSSFAGVSSSEIFNDPLFITRLNQIQKLSSAQNFKIEQGFVKAVSDKQEWFFFSITLKDNSDFKASESITNFFEELAQEANEQGLKFFYTGSVFYNNYATQLASKDVSYLGSASIFAVIFLIFLCFRSVYPLILTIITIVVSSFSALAVCLLVFDKVFLFAMLMSISVVGMAVDYSIYFLSQCVFQPSKLFSCLKIKQLMKVDNGVYNLSTELLSYSLGNFTVSKSDCSHINCSQSLKQDKSSIFPVFKQSIRPLFLSLLTVGISYLLVMLAPFPVIRQIACFALVALIVAFLTVLLLYPKIGGRIPKKSTVPFKVLFFCYVNWWTHKTKTTLLLSCISVFIVVGLSKVNINDDVKVLQSTSDYLSYQEQMINKIVFKGHQAQHVILVGNSFELLLQYQEALVNILNRLKTEDIIYDFALFPLNSLKQQAQDISLIKQNYRYVLEAYQDILGADEYQELLKLVQTELNFLTLPKLNKHEQVNSCIESNRNTQVNINIPKKANPRSQLSLVSLLDYNSFKLSTLSTGWNLLSFDLTQHNEDDSAFNYALVLQVFDVKDKTYLQKLLAQHHTQIMDLLKENLIVQDSSLEFSVKTSAEVVSSNRSYINDLNINVVVLDKRETFSLVFAQYREFLNILLVVCLIVVFIFSVIRQGFKQGIFSFLCIVLAVLSAIASLGFVALPFNLFASLALILVVGIGLNYTIFFSSESKNQIVASFAIALALVTSLLTLGILVFAHTIAVACFGLALSAGLLCSFLLAPMSAIQSIKKS